ncbi:peptidylprolyl isomerase [Aurantibacillus circumpalustris]|uniref:peptidylprolyl isomerase n=1 Tax=Aurantibacillus circumpalustris TaxID=3036359 RepID=UPI00295AE9D8|nr:peptidylprolyl isomerase [Aurantibacillus circumpalustris]
MKNKSLIVVALTVTTFVNSIKAQDPVVMTINEKPIKKSEFEAVYHKNNGKETSASSKSIKEYVDLFSLYKSKVFEAESLGLDTLESFKSELAGYRRQLAAPYLTDKNTNESLLTEAYERMKSEVRASHILIKLDESALPKDTLEAWTRINIIRNAVLGKLPTQADIANYEKLLRNTTEVSKRLKNQDSTLLFARTKLIKSLAANSRNEADKFIAFASICSDDPSASENKGDLNYFSALDMVYPFESAAYNTAVGEISPIVRTRFGYHILKVYDKRVSRGELTVAHIMSKFPKEASEQDKKNAKVKIDEIYTKLKAGQNFEELARQFSDDKQSSDRGGQLQPFKGGRLPKSFEDAAFGLRNNNDISTPVLTPFGWHIIKRMDLKVLPTFDEIKNELKARVARDSRSQMGRVALIEKIKKENGFKENAKNLADFVKIIDSTYLKATWKAERASKLGNKEIFNLAGKSYTQNDFAKFMETQMTYKTNADLNELVRSTYKTWVEESMVAYEDSHLEKKYVEFANLYREYRDGILLFDLTDQKVWSRAVKDTAGLRAFYEGNKNNYLWDERADVTTYKCLNEKVAKDVRKSLKAGKSEKQITDALNKSSQLNVSVENITYLKGENKNVDANWKSGVLENDIKEENNINVIVVNKLSPKTPKTLGECRGSVTADYQNYLDKEWLSYLKSKYIVKLNQEALDTVK